MNKQLIEYLMKLFAILANIYPSLLYENIRDFIKSVLLKDFSDSVIYSNIQVFQNFYHSFEKISNSAIDRNQLQVLLMQDIKTIENEISGKQKFVVLLRLMLFEKFLLKYSRKTSSYTDFKDILDKIAGEFKIDNVEYSDCRSFISETLYNIQSKDKLLIVSGNKLIDIDISFLNKEQLNGQLFFFFIKSIRMIIFYYDGTDTLDFNNQSLYSNHIYEFQRGHFISGFNFEAIYYNQILKILNSKEKTSFLIEVDELEYRFRRSDKGIHRLSLLMRSGEMIGMVGRSGAGKSTLLNLLNGNLKPSMGSIRINSLDLQTEKDQLVGLIGYVPQDDLLIEELSVFKNLFLNAQLCFSNIATEELTRKVNNLLIELNLYEVRNLVVGSPLNKFISGGQRKKLNIALELIREPWILFADEPTSGLSSSDSEEIMQHLSELAISGRLVFVNVHQPSSDIFKLFDRVLVMDNDGYAAFFGNPVDSISYFHTINNSQLSITDKCEICGNLNTESIFKALEEKQVNELGEYTSIRKTSPELWNNYFNQNLNLKSPGFSIQLPENHLTKPGALKQFSIFFNRNFLSKISNRSYVALALTISPFLALILAILCRSGIDTNTNHYSFGENENISAFLFMSVIVSLFVGLIISAEEIIRDRRILIRESFLRLNKSSYIFSKVVYLFALSTMQTVLFVVISNTILEIHGMLIPFSIILFSSSFFSNVLGLFISSIFKSVVVIYILVPLLIVPQILLSGVVVSFEKINESVSSGKFVPLVGDLMVSRWAYEALLVSQFRFNSFQTRFFEVEKQMSNSQFDYLFTIPDLKESVDNFRNLKSNILNDNSLTYIYHQLLELHENNPQLSLTIPNEDLLSFITQYKIDKYLDNLNNFLWNKNKRLSSVKDSIIHEMISRLGSKNLFSAFKMKHFNKNLSEFMLKRQSLQPFTKTKSEMIRKLEPVYQNTTSNWGRAQFLASDKKIANFKLITPIFNVLVIWMITIFILLILLAYSRRSVYR